MKKGDYMIHVSADKKYSDCLLGRSQFICCYLWQ